MYSISNIDNKLHTENPLWYTDDPKMWKIIEKTIFPAIPGHFRMTVKEFVEDSNARYNKTLTAD